MISGHSLSLERKRICGGLFFFALLFLAGQPADATYKFPDNEEKFISGMAEYFNNGNFEHLDKLAKILRTSKSRFQGGDWKIVCFYEGLRRVPGMTKASETMWEMHQDRFKKWIEKYPDSVTAKIGYAAFLCDYAWKARGGSKAYKVDENQWDVFHERLNEAEKILNSVSNSKRKNYPMWYSIMQTVALGQGWERDRYEKLFNDAIACEPSFENYYYTKAHHLLPRWGGKKGEWERFAMETREKIGGQEGAVIYAYICKMLSRYFPHEGFFGVVDVDWEEIKKGMRAREELYGTSNRNLNEFLRLACLAEDKKTARDLFEWMEDDWDKYVWGAHWRVEQYRKWAYSSGGGNNGVWKKGLSDLKGEELKDFGFKDINGNLVKMSRLGADLILINVWRQRLSKIPDVCSLGSPPPSELMSDEIKVLNKLHKEFPRKKLKIIGLSRGSKMSAEHLLEQIDVKYTLVMVDFMPYPFSNVKNFPAFFIVSREGFVLEVLEGNKTYEELRKAILRHARPRKGRK